MAHRFFYDQPIVASNQQQLIEQTLKKYSKEKPTPELKQKIWDELQQKKHEGVLTIPFKLVLRQDPTGKYPDFIEVILDTKV